MSAIGKLLQIFHLIAPDALKIKLLISAVKTMPHMPGIPLPQSEEVKHARCRSLEDDLRCTRHQLAEKHHEQRSLRKIRSYAVQSNYPKKETSLDRPLVAP